MFLLAFRGLTVIRLARGKGSGDLMKSLINLRARPSLRLP
jgi:hypothetical protein